MVEFRIRGRLSPRIGVSDGIVVVEFLDEENAPQKISVETWLKLTKLLGKYVEIIVREVEGPGKANDDVIQWLKSQMGDDEQKI